MFGHASFRPSAVCHVAHENFGLSAPFLPGGLDIVFEDILADSIGIFG